MIQKCDLSGKERHSVALHCMELTSCFPKCVHKPKLFICCNFNLYFQVTENICCGNQFQLSQLVIFIGAISSLLHDIVKCLHVATLL